MKIGPATPARPLLHNGAAKARPRLRPALSRTGHAGAGTIQQDVLQARTGPSRPLLLPPLPPSAGPRSRCGMLWLDAGRCPCRPGKPASSRPSLCIPGLPCPPPAKARPVGAKLAEPRCPGWTAIRVLGSAPAPGRPGALASTVSTVARPRQGPRSWCQPMTWPRHDVVLMRRSPIGGGLHRCMHRFCVLDRGKGAPGFLVCRPARSGLSLASVPATSPAQRRDLRPLRT